MAHIHLNDRLTTNLRLIITMVLNLVITATELVGGLLAGSLSLISDALHNLSDGISVLITFIAIRLKSREHSYRHTFGLKRAEIFAAVINAVVLIGITGYLLYESIARLIHSSPVEGGLMSMVAGVGLVANVIGTWLLHRDAASSLNIRSSYLHLFSDALSSLAVLLGGLAIYFWQAYFLDPLLTLVIGLYILYQSYQVLGQAVHVLMEGAPPDIDLEEIRRAVESIPEVRDMHHLHIWTVGENDVHLEAHVNVCDMRVSETQPILTEIEKRLLERFNIRHVTIQFECDQCPEIGLIHRGESRQLARKM
ncbi:MAG: cation transporter [Calditrichaeota bacterium]|nr:MAG: cation transporter [Calditrichota bacterium]